MTSGVEPLDRDSGVWVSVDDLRGPGAAEAFGRIFDEHYRGVHRYLSRRIGEHAADDIAAETFLVAYRERHRYDPVVAPIRAWLLGIATNLLRQQWRLEARGYRDTAYAEAVAAPVGAHDVALVRSMTTRSRQCRGTYVKWHRRGPGWTGRGVAQDVDGRRCAGWRRLLRWVSWWRGR